MNLITKVFVGLGVAVLGSYSLNCLLNATGSGFEQVDDLPIITPVIDDIKVRGHKRKLPEGYHASSEKFDSAKALGYSLEDGETWVGSYNRKYRRD